MGVILSLHAPTSSSSQSFELPPSYSVFVLVLLLLLLLFPLTRPIPNPFLLARITHAPQFLTHPSYTLISQDRGTWEPCLLEYESQLSSEVHLYFLDAITLSSTCTQLNSRLDPLITHLFGFIHIHQLQLNLRAKTFFRKWQKRVPPPPKPQFYGDSYDYYWGNLLNNFIKFLITK